MRVGKLSRYLQVPLLPLGVPSMLAPARSTQILSPNYGVWRGLTTADVDVTHGQIRITKCYTSVVHSILRHFASW